MPSAPPASSVVRPRAINSRTRPSDRVIFRIGNRLGPSRPVSALTTDTASPPPISPPSRLPLLMPFEITRELPRDRNRGWMPRSSQRAREGNEMRRRIACLMVGFLLLMAVGGLITPASADAAVSATVAAAFPDGLPAGMVVIDADTVASVDGSILLD